MTHMVLGYPSVDANLELAQTLADAGAEILELQIPFSDPLADGPIILRANQIALDNGMTVKLAFSVAKTISQMVGIPTIIMTYYNLLYNMGIEAFLNEASKSDVKGLIVPDMPFDDTLENFYKKASGFDIDIVPVFSPSMRLSRLEQALAELDIEGSMIYSTLRVGITGEKKIVEQTGIDFLTQIRQHSTSPHSSGIRTIRPANTAIINWQSRHRCGRLPFNPAI